HICLYSSFITVDFYRILRKWGKAYYPVYRMWIIDMAIINISHPDDLEILLTSKNHINKNFGYFYFTPWLKSGLLTSRSDYWFHRRRILTPAFHFNILKELMKTIIRHTDKYIFEMKTLGSESIIDLEPFCIKFTLNVLCGKNLRPYLKDWALPFVPHINKRLKKSAYDMDKFINDIVVKRRQYHEESNYENLEKFDCVENLDEDDCYTLNLISEGKKKQLAMLDLLLAAERNKLIDHEGIKEEVATFVFAGHDTTGTAFIFTTLLLAEHKDVQELARKEVEEVFNQNGGNLNFSALNDLKYVERCIKESMRLYPPVPTIVRYMTEDLQMKNCLAPKGSNVMIHIVDVHRDPNFWPEPDKFDPDRFLPHEVNNRHPFAYIPFSAGFRNCIGQKLAMMELKSVISTILYNFYIEPVDKLGDFEAVADAITRPSRPVKAKFVRINKF
ncbi:cytochrome P450 4C1, partial [Copidosoma floridanum]|uniref:cytochrome P450 4C1 n=1 Tax=Copidosoma floridanum TaxID=29053 RepID=UPI000C6F5C20